MKIIVFCTVFLLPFTSFSSQYLCIAELSTGYMYDTSLQEWKRVQFNVEGSKYVISPSDQTEYAYEVKQFNSERPDWFCKKNISEFGFLKCTGLLDSKFKFNNDNRRFMMTSSFGYVEVLPDMNKLTDDSTDTPNMEIGACSPF